MRVVKCVRFSDPSLDVCDYVVAYLQKSFMYRAKAVSKGFPKPRQLFLSYSTGKPLCRASISKYILDVLALAGIDVSCFRAHTARGSVPSALVRRGASPGQILAQSDWKHLGTFQKFYDHYSEDSVEGRLIKQVTRCM